MNKSLPGYKSIAEFARVHAVPYRTAKKQLHRGHCAWPRRQVRGQTKHPLYSTWCNIKTRCYNKKGTSWSMYGGRGIRMCTTWRNSFDTFVADMGPKPGPEYSIDRIDNDKGYSPENCRWATQEEQSINRRIIFGNIYRPKGRRKYNVTWRSKVVYRTYSLKEAEDKLRNLRDNFYGEGNY